MAESFGSTYHNHDSIIVSAGVDEFVQLVLDVQHGMRHLFHQAFSSSILPCSHLQAKAAMSIVCNFEQHAYIRQLRYMLEKCLCMSDGHCITLPK